VSSKLQSFTWHGITCSGEAIHGQITAAHHTEAKNQLRKQGIITHSIVKKKRWRSILITTRIKPREIALLSRQLSTTIKTGLPLVQALQFIAKSHMNQRMQQLVTSIQHDIEMSLTLAEALQKHPHLFSPLICNLVALGEESGTLDIMLTHIMHHLEHTERLKQRIRKAITYPLAVLLIALCVTVGLLIGVVPQFESLFQQFGAQLPWMTLEMIHLSHIIQAHWKFGVISLYLIVLSVRFAYHHMPSTVRVLDTLLLILPLVGPILTKTITARISSTLAITHEAGLPLVDALKSIALIANNQRYAEALLQVNHAISQGERLQSALRDTRLFPELMIHMIDLGEETGTLSDTLNHVAEYDEEALDHLIHTLTNRIEPLLMTLLGILIGGLMLTMYFPILKLGSIV